MKCTTCGQDNPEQAKYCNYCGSMTQITKTNDNNENTIPVSEPISQISDSIVDSKTSTTNNTSVPPSSPVPVTYKIVTPGGPQTSRIDDQTIGQIKKPNATGQIIFSVVNIICCGSMVFGIIALVFSLMATSENDFCEAKNKLKIAKILNIIGIAISILLFIATIVIIILCVMYGTVEVSGTPVVKSDLFGTFQ